jgi:hypothetical protein
MNDIEKIEWLLEDLKLFPETNYGKLETALKIALDFADKIEIDKCDYYDRVLLVKRFRTAISEALEGKP